MVHIERLRLSDEKDGGMQPFRTGNIYAGVMKSLGLLVLAAMMVAGVPSTGMAAWSEFLPKIYDYGADLKLTSSYESTDNKVNGKGNNWNDTFIKETIGMYVDGFSYDPKFVQFRLAVSGGLKQEDFSASSLSDTERTGWRTGTAKEYDFTLFLLPDHPYNLRLFSYHSEPLFKTEFAVSIPISEDGKGAVLRYKRKPFFVSTSYTTVSSESGSSSSDVDSVTGNVTYLKDFSHQRNLTVASSYDHSNFSDSSGLTGNSSDYQLTGNLSLGMISLNAGATKSDYQQENASSSNSNDATAVRGGLFASLPLNFGAGFSYDYSKNTSNVASPTTPATESSSTSNGLAFSITHRLFKSLNSYYTFQKNSLSGSFGETDTTSNTLTFSYNKVIPWGTLVAGLTLGRSTLDSKGAASVVNEPHLQVPVPVPGSFPLNQLGIDPATIIVFVKDPVPPNQLVQLNEGINYVLDTTPSGFIEITNITLPLTPDFPVPGSYDFFVTYSLKAADFKVREDTIGYNASLSLFNGMVNPFFSYSKTSSTVESGTFPEGEPLSASSTSVGLVFYREPFRVITQYTEVSSNLNSSKMWKAEAMYSKAISETTRLYTSATYAVTSYPQGTSLEGGPGYDQQSGSFSANLMKRFPSKNLSLSGGGTYSYVTAGPTKSTAYSFTSNLAWRVGKVFLSLGANMMFADSEGTQQLKTESFRQYYYLNVRRKLL